ncbi:MAG: FAD-dependent oxidoreductase [Pseudomonadota bacterium]
MPERLVVIGAGMASGRVLEHLFEDAPGAYNVTLFGAEPRGNYDRIMLSPVLSGEKTYEEIVTHDANWYAENAVTCRFGEAVTGIDRDRKVVLSKEGETPYDKLVIATGSAPFIIPVPGKDLPGVITYRDLDDTNAMIGAAAKPGAKAVVVGGGLLGLEAAAGLKMRGMAVTVLHLIDHIMERQLDPAASQLLRSDLESRGIRVHTKANTHEIVGTDRVEAVRLDDGIEYEADIVVMAVGIRPETALAQDAGLACGRGLHVDDQMITSDENILAVGECVEHRGSCYGLVAPLYEMAKVAAKTLAGEPAAYTGSSTSTKLKVTGVNLFSAGDFAEADDREEIVFRDPGRAIYKRLVLQNDRIIGAVLYGDVTDGPWFFERLKSQTDVADVRDTLIFGPAYAEGTALDPMVAAAASRGDFHLPRRSGPNTPSASALAA